jgi:hypothetical protein
MLKFNAPKGARVKKGTWPNQQGKRLRVFINACIDFENTTGDFHFCLDERQWANDTKIDRGVKAYSTHSLSIKSIRAFRRRLRQWARSRQLPKGTKLILVSRFPFHQVTAKIY